MEGKRNCMHAIETLYIWSVLNVLKQNNIGWLYLLSCHVSVSIWTASNQKPLPACEVFSSQNNCYFSSCFSALHLCISSSLCGLSYLLFLFTFYQLRHICFILLHLYILFRFSQCTVRVWVHPTVMDTWSHQLRKDEESSLNIVLTTLSYSWCTVAWHSLNPKPCHG